MASLNLSINPFRNDQEVRQFKELVYSDHVDDKRVALQKMDQLEARVNPLPLGLSSLRHILKVEIIRAELEDKKQTDENGSLQYACAIAVLKFVDAVSVPYRTHHSRLSYRNIAKQVDLPGNIISLRHDIAHNHELPSLTDLLNAIDYSKQWIRKNCLDELIETMILFSEGSYGEFLEIVARETINAFVEARMNFFLKRSKKRLRLADERVEEVRKALQMCNGREIMADSLVQCGHLIMLPNQLKRLHYDPDSTDLLPSCTITFWKPIIQLILHDHSLIKAVVDKILIFLTDYYRLPTFECTLIDKQRVGWVFYLAEQSSTDLDLCSIFIRFARILQPWFAQHLSMLAVRMADPRSSKNGAIISEQKRDILLKTISLFTNPHDYVEESESAIPDPIDMFPRDKLNKREMTLFYSHLPVAEVPIGVLHNDENQNLEIDVDLTKIDRNLLGCLTKPKIVDSAPTKRRRTASPSIDSSIFHELYWRQSQYR